MKQVLRGFPREQRVVVALKSAWWRGVRRDGWQLSFLKGTACKEFSTRPQGGFNYEDGKVQRNGFSGSPKVTYSELGWQEGYLATTTERGGKGRRGKEKR